ncbi:hypothetical protein LEP1GSC111_2470 [Leptospira interrogans str. UT126]|nr:hypothetical protein LEP1GSC111_2470 [Leptospira interrogans str. UT126]
MKYKRIINQIFAQNCCFAVVSTLEFEYDRFKCYKLLFYKLR